MHHARITALVDKLKATTCAIIIALQPSAFSLNTWVVTGNVSHMSMPVMQRRPAALSPLSGPATGSTSGRGASDGKAGKALCK
jgi:hypothetical protein